jgi:hypothetical protein
MPTKVEGTLQEVFNGLFRSLYSRLLSSSIEATCAASFAPIGFQGYNSVDCNCFLTTLSLFQGYTTSASCVFDDNRCLLPSNGVCSTAGYALEAVSSGSVFGPDVVTGAFSSLFSVQSEYDILFSLRFEKNICFASIVIGDAFLPCDSCEICSSGTDTGILFDCSSIDVSMSNTNFVPGPLTTSCVDVSFI